MVDVPELKLFGHGDRAYVQAQQVWLILAAKVMCPDRSSKRPGLITYGELAKLMRGDPRAGRSLAPALGIVGAYCKLNDLPTLNSVVVNEKTGVPGDHVVVRNGRTPAQEQAAALKQNWFGIRVPTTGTFRKVWESAKALWGTDQW